MEVPRASKRKSDARLSHGVPSGIDLETGTKAAGEMCLFFCIEGSALVLASLENAVGVGKEGVLGGPGHVAGGWWTAGSGAGAGQGEAHVLEREDGGGWVSLKGVRRIPPQNRRRQGL